MMSSNLVPSVEQCVGDHGAGIKREQWILMNYSFTSC